MNAGVGIGGGGGGKGEASDALNTKIGNFVEHIQKNKIENPSKEACTV